MRGFGFASRSRPGCEYCNSERMLFRPYDTMSHGRLVCFDHIEKANEDHHRELSESNGDTR